MNNTDQGKPESQKGEAEAQLKALEIELMFKRDSWKKGQARRRSWRALSFFFIFIVIVAAICALYYVMAVMPRKTAQPTTPPLNESPSG